jgi:Na+/H+ antiporter NhaD/arsenite permease-like protein
LPSFLRSFRGQVTMLLCVITIVLVAASIFPYFQKGHAIASCYGAAIAWIAGWGKNKQRMRL